MRPPAAVAHRLLGAARRGVVLGDQLRLRLHERREADFEDLGHLLVHLLPGALEQRRIGSVLDEGVLKQIPGPWRPPPLVEDLGFTSWANPSCKAVPSCGAMAASNSWETPGTAPSCATSGPIELIQPSHERILEGVRNRHRAQRSREHILVLFP